MLWIIARKEFFEHVISFRFAVSAAICLALVSACSYVLIQNYQMEVDSYRANVADDEALVESFARPEQLVNTGAIAYREPRVLEIFSSGVAPAIPRSIRLNLAQTGTQKGLLTENPISGLFGDLDYQWIVVTVLSLLAMLFSYDAISGEREKGTLPLMLAGAVPRGSVLLGKYLGGYLALLVPFCVSSLLVLLFLILTPEVYLDAEGWWRVTLFGFTSLVYVSVFFTLGFAVSARARRSFESILILLTLWALVVWTTPKIGASVLEEMTRFPTIMQQLQRAREQQWEELDKLPGAKDEEVALEILAGIEASLFDEHFRRIAAAVNQVSLVTKISPATCYFFATSELAGTGWPDVERFLRSAVQYRRRLVNYGRAKVRERNRLHLPQIEFLADRPVFFYTPRSVREALTAVWPDVLILLIWNVVLFAASYLFFVRRELV